MGARGRERGGEGLQKGGCCPCSCCRVVGEAALLLALLVLVSGSALAALAAECVVALRGCGVAGVERLVVARLRAWPAEAALAGVLE